MTGSQISQFVAGLIFLLTLAVLVTDRIHRTIVVSGSASVMVAAGLLLGFYSQGQALSAIDFNTISLLLGMMLLMALLSKTGVFEYLAIAAARRSEGSPWRFLVLMGALTTVISMFLNNMTVMLLIAPVTLLVAEKLRVDPVPLLIAQAVLSNIGGTATLIGDPPNMLIGSAAGFSFNKFLIILLPIVLVVYYPTLLALRHVLGYRTEIAAEPRELRSLPSADLIRNPQALRKLLLVLAAVIVLFVLQDLVPLQAGYVAFAGTAMALLWLRPDLEELLREVDWSMLLFFACLFVVVGGLEAAGIMKAIAELIVSFTHSHPLLTSVLLLWGAAVLSSVLDNIPFVIAMIPIVKGLETEGVNVEPLWWALALGAGFGANATPIGSSANIVTIAISERAGYPITFRRWFRSGAIAALVSCSIGTLLFLLIFGMLKR